MILKLLFLTTLFAPVMSALAESLDSASRQRKRLPASAFSIQYAGSTGFLTGGYFIGTASEKLFGGIQYGYTPVSMGGPIHTISLKFMVDPFSIMLRETVSIRPVQAGVFFTQSFGSNLPFSWDHRYPASYYWWLPSQRWHVFVSSALMFSNMGHGFIKRSSIYLESNTNDLYIYSYASNTATLSLWDIVFFGVGVRLYY